MSTQKTQSKCSEIIVTSAIDVANAAAARDALLGAVAAATSAAPAIVEFDAPGPTAPALQLAAATRLSLVARDAFAGLGPLAAVALAAPDPACGDAA